MLYHYLTFMLNMFRLKYTNTSSGEIRVPNEGYQLNIAGPRRRKSDTFPSTGTPKDISQK